MKKAFFAGAALGALGLMTSNERRLGRYIRDGEGHPTETAAQMATRMKAQFQTSLDAVKSLAEDALGKAAAGETLTNDLKQTIDEALVKMNEHKEQLDEIDQKLARNPGSEPEGRKSAGYMVIEDEGTMSSSF